ncbi:MAG: hypothetical protein IJF33_06550, partial [Clostridia bacterium]|nr:hypothetical protein [Clostridia bacterium]
TSKIIASMLFLILLGAVIHVILFVLTPIPMERRDMTASELMYYGAQMTGGGVLGGKVGYFLYSCLNITGTVIIGVCLLSLLLFYVLGMTPQNLWDQFRAARKERVGKEISASEQEAEDARNKAKMEEKIRKSTTRQLSEDGSDDVSGGAVKVVEAPAEKKTEADKLAPMPLPRLDPNDGSRPFVPREVGRKLNESNAAERAATATKSATQSVASAINPKPAASASAPTQTATPQPIANPAKNRDTAVDPIFPRTSDGKQVRKVPKEERNFDLKNVFVNMEDSEPAQAKKHAPVPPEVPLATGARPSTVKTASSVAPVQKAAPTTAAPTARPATSVAKPASTASTGTAKAPSLSAIKPAPVAKTAPGTKPVFRQADKSTQKEFGLSSEEFEQLEAKNTTPNKAKAPDAKNKVTASTNTPVKATTKKAGASDKPKKYVFPPISYLHPGEPMTEENRAEIHASMNQLAETLASFHVKVKEINYSCGPTVTRYEVVLAAGVRVRTITNLADDIALALRSSGGVRIEAPIPGTNAVGIEVPNKTRSIIYLRDLIESKLFRDSKSKLSACLGADIAGAPLIFDIAKMPHLLIAGT